MESMTSTVTNAAKNNRLTASYAVGGRFIALDRLFLRASLGPRAIRR